MTTYKPYSTRSGSCHEVKGLRKKRLITATDLAASVDGREVVGVLNPSVVQLDGSTYLVVRVDERSKKPEEWHPLDFRREVPQAGRIGAHTSHFRLVQLTDSGLLGSSRIMQIDVGIFAEYGYEDPRCTSVGDCIYVVFSAVSRFGLTAWMGELTQSRTLQRLRMILGPDHKHTVLLPAIDRRDHILLTRPLARQGVKAIGIWLLLSPDLAYFGNPKPILMPRRTHWDCKRVGAAGVPLRLNDDWLVPYYGVDIEESYHMGFALLDGNTLEVTARTLNPVLSPDLDWERHGRRADTVFSCGVEWSRQEGSRELRIFYGAADESVGVAELPLASVKSELEPCSPVDVENL